MLREGWDDMAAVSEDCYNNAFRSGRLRIDPREPFLALFLVRPVDREGVLYPASRGTFSVAA